MINTLIKKSWIPLTIIGTLLTAIIFFGNGMGGSVITKNYKTIGSFTWVYFTFDIRSYLINLETAIKIDYLTNSFESTQPYLPKTPNWADIWNWSTSFKFIGNMFIWVPNLFIWIINATILLPIKILIYPLNIMLTLIGIRTVNTPLTTVLETITNFSLGYIKYIN